MKVKGFGARPSRNVSSGGQKGSFDEYNRSFKGDPYNFAYKKKNYGDFTGYMDRGVEEYYRVSEMKDTTSDDDQKEKKNATAAGAAAAAGKSRQVVLRQVAGLLMGAVVITAGYQASLKLRSQPPVDPTAAAAVVEPTEDSADDATNPTQDPAQQPTNSPNEDPTTPTQAPTQSPTQDPTNGTTNPAQEPDQEPNVTPDGGAWYPDQQSSTSTVSWRWNDDGSAVLVLTDSAGNTISEIYADVTTSTVAATCSKAGRNTYTASAEVYGQTFTDVRYEDLPALGHSFDSGKEVTLKDGRTAMQYECTRCHKHFTVVNSIDEE